MTLIVRDLMRFVAFQLRNDFADPIRREMSCSLRPGMIHFALDDLFGQLTKKALERLYNCLSPVSPVRGQCVLARPVDMRASNIWCACKVPSGECHVRLNRSLVKLVPASCEQLDDDSQNFSN